MGRALYLLSHSPLSEAQLKRRLVTAGASADEADRCAKKLAETGLIDDGKFALNYTEYRVAARGLGRHRIARELAAKGVSSQFVETALSSVFDRTPESELIDKAIRKRTRSSGLPRSPREYQRLFGSLMRLGFSRELIVDRMQHIEAAQREDSPND